MAYQACYECEMVYEVDTDGSACPQCNRPLEPYDYEPEVEAPAPPAPAPPAPAPPAPAPPPPMEPPATVALDSANLPPLPELGVATPGDAPRKSTLLGPPKPVPQPFAGDAPGAIDLHHSPVTGNTDPMPAPNIPRAPEEAPAELPRTMALSPGDLPELGPIGVASSAAPEVDPGGDMPRTMALSPDQLADLPPMGEMPPLGSGEPDGPRRTMAIDAGALAAASEGLTPQPPVPSAPSQEVPVIAERAAIPTGTTERHMAKLSTIKPRSRKSSKKSKVGLIVVISLLVLGGVGAAVYFFVFADGAKKTAPVVEAPPPAPPTWDERLETQIADGQAVLPSVKGGARLTEGVFVAGGLEGFSTSLGPVTGMASTKVRPDHIKTDDNGTWLPALRSVLARHPGAATDVLSFAIDGGINAQHLVYMANSGARAGFKRCALVALRAGGDGELSSLPFLCEGAIPAQGAVVYRVGKLNDYVAVKDQAKETLSEGVPQLARNEDGKPNFDAITARLKALKGAHSTVDRVILYPNELMTGAQLAELVARIQTGPKAARYEKVALGL